MIAAIAAFLLCAMLLLPGCKAQEVGPSESAAGQELVPMYQTLAELKGKTVAAVAGSAQEQRARQSIEDVHIVYVENQADALMEVANGHADAMLITGTSFAAARESAPGLTRMPETFHAQNGACVAFPKTERGAMLRDQMNTLLAELKADGTLDAWDQEWKDTHASHRCVDLNRITGENGTLQAAVSTDAGDPFIYFKEDKLVGYEIDLMARFCAQYGYDLEMTNYGFSSLLPAVSGGKADIAACTIAITEERKESVNFSLPTYEGGVVTVAKSGPEEELPAETVQKKIGVVLGTMYEDIARRLYPDEELCFYDNTADLAKALDKGEIDFYMVDEPVGRLLIKPYPDQHLSKIIEPASFAFAFPKDSERSSVLRVQMDAFIEE